MLRPPEDPGPNIAPLKRYCFACGRPAPEEPGGEARLAAMCLSCRRGGPQVDERMRRWLLSGPGLPRSPLSREEIRGLLASGSLPEDADIAREGGEFLPLCAHPDFRELFLPGAPAALALRSAQAARRDARRRDDRALRRRRGLAILLAIASLALAWYASSARLFVVPESVLQSISLQVQALRGGGAPQAALPGEAMQAHLPEPASVEQRLPALRIEAEAGLLAGTAAARLEARIAAERAAALAPSDVEAVALLAEVYAGLLSREPGLRVPLAGALERASALDAPSIATARALAAFALAEGRSSDAADHVRACGAGSAEQILAGLDLRCALLHAEARRDRTALDAIGARFPQAAAARIAAARVAMAVEDWPDALRRGQALRQELPQEPAGWQATLAAALALGEWTLADTAGQKVATLAPEDLAARRRWARLRSRLMGRPEAALAELQAVIDHPGFAAHPEAPDILLDAAEAAVRLERWPLAAELAARSQEQKPRPATRILLAWALLQGGDAAAARGSMAGSPIDSTERATARLHLGAARVYLALGEPRLAGADLEEALRLDPDLGEAHFDLARARLAADDVEGAVQNIEDAAFAEGVYGARRSPLPDPWIPPGDLAALGRTLWPRLEQDARLSQRIDELSGILAWARGDALAADALDRVLEGSAPPAPAAAALAQLRIARDTPRTALPLLERALAARPDDASLLAMQGYALSCTGRPADARTAQSILRRALSLDPTSPAVLYWNAAALEQQGEVQAAREAYLTLRRATPGGSLPHVALRRLAAP